MHVIISIINSIALTDNPIFAKRSSVRAACVCASNHIIAVPSSSIQPVARPPHVHRTTSIHRQYWGCIVNSRQSMTVNEFRITSRPPRPSPFVPSSESSQTAIRIVYHSKANTTTYTQTLSLVAAGACTIHASHYVLVVVHTRALSLIAPNKFEINILALA